jgi:hypothetical protein
MKAEIGKQKRDAYRPFSASPFIVYLLVQLFSRCEKFAA